MWRNNSTRYPFVFELREGSCAFIIRYGASRLYILGLQVCGEILGERFTGITNIRGVWDFKTFLQGIRPRAADKGIQTKFSLQLKATEDGSKIQVRHKAAVDVRVPFGPFKVMLPDSQRPDAIPHRDAVPPVCAAKRWPEFEAEIVPTLRKFYKEEFMHPVHIPEADRKEMLDFFTHGPDPPATPGWIAWDDVVENSDTEVEDTTTTTAEFPFPVGTWVAFEFSDRVYPGTIEFIHADVDPPECRVKFTDGDMGDYDADEIHYAVQLYQRDFQSSVQ